MQQQPKATHAAPIVVFYCNGLGDALMTLPALRALAAHYRDQLVLICSDVDHRVLFQHNLKVRTHCIEVQYHAGGHTFGVAAALAAVPRCGLLIRLVPWQSPSLQALAQAWQAPSIGCFSDCETTVTWLKSRHAVNNAFAIVQRLNPQAALTSFDQPPLLSDHAFQLADKVMALMPNRAELIAIHPESRPEKTWPSDAWRRFLDGFLAQRPRAVVLVLSRAATGLDSGPYAERICACAGLPLEAVYALVARCALFIGVDSCLLHAADAFRIPSVALFGPSDPREFGLFWAAHRLLRAKPISNIQPAAVLAQSLALLAESEATPRQSGAADE